MSDLHNMFYTFSELQLQVIKQLPELETIRFLFS